MLTENFQMHKLELKKTDEPKINYQNYLDHGVLLKGFLQNIYPCFIDNTKSLDYVGHSKQLKIFKEMGVQTILPISWKICMWVKKQSLELDMEKWTGSKSGKEYVKAVYCHLAYLTCMQSTSCKMLCQMTHKLESRLPGEIWTTSDLQMIPL